MSDKSDDQNGGWAGDIENTGPPEGNTNAMTTGFYTKTKNLDDDIQKKIQRRAESYIEEIGEEGDEYNWEYEGVREQTKYDCYLLALTEWRIAQAEGIMVQDVKEYLKKVTPEQNMERLVNRRQNLRKDLGLLSESPEHRQADAQKGFFDALNGDNE